MLASALRAAAQPASAAAWQRVCLSALRRGTCSSSVGCRRSLATAAQQSAAGCAPEYRRVPFVKEDLATVMNEVPDFRYYYIGNENASSYPYKDVPMHQPILDTVSPNIL